MLYKIINGLCPSYLNGLLPCTINEKTNYALRSGNLLQEPFTRLECYRRSFFPFAIRKWNMLSDETKQSPNIENFKFLLTQKHSNSDPPFYFWYGERWPNIHHARLRMGCSKLNGDLFNNHIRDSPICQCGFHTENAIHYFFDCPNYARERIVMFNKIEQIRNVTAKTLLFGNKNLTSEENLIVINAVHSYICESKRF